MNEKDPIFRSLAMIEERIHEKLTVEMLAEGIHFSKYYYQRIFREAVGDTVMGYVNRRRLLLAAEDLAKTEDSILAIALRYGYDSHEGFTRSFKAHMGVTPTEYRKYHSSIRFLGMKKEERADLKHNMLKSKSADEMVKELNRLIVQAKETAADTRKYKGDDAQAAAIYTQGWEFAAIRAEKMAGQLEEILERVAFVVQNPDEISARFRIVKAVEDAAFEANVTAFQVGLMTARALPECRAAFEPLCARYDSLARDARIETRKMVDFFNELWRLILQDMRKNAEQRLQNAVEAGLTAAEKVSDPKLPYGYIADGIKEIAEELAALSLEDVTVYCLEDAIFRLDAVRFAADMDMRAPQHRELFDSILNFREKLGEAVEFFQNLSGEDVEAFKGENNASEMIRTDEKRYSDLAAQEGILLFYLKGEIYKLGDAHLDEGKKRVWNDICGKMDRAVRMARNAVNGDEGNESRKLLREAYEEMRAEAEWLGIYGGVIRYLAEEVRKPL